MELETLAGYLVALAVPVWLLVEGVMVSQWFPSQPAKRFERSKHSSKPTSRASTAAARPRAMQEAESRKTA